MNAVKHDRFEWIVLLCACDVCASAYVLRQGTCVDCVDAMSGFVLSIMYYYYYLFIRLYHGVSGTWLRIGNRVYVCVWA